MSEQQPSEEEDDPQPGIGQASLNRRRFLNWTTAVVGAVGVGYAAVPFIQSMSASASVKAAGAPIEVDISKVKEGQMITAYWRSKPIWILHRTQRQLGTLKKVESRLKDPNCAADQEPEAMQKASYWKDTTRSIRPEILVLVGICTHLGCIPKYRPNPNDPELGSNWPGGFFCPCHGSMYDISGRVMDGSPAPLNLPVPPYFFKEKSVVRVGELENGSDQNWAPNTW
ncbi:MAG TPA: ubiquinol-cytochrome c reductase iron-sulfur subunit [Gammaproteobacteria bacterium]|nr:ubiquinol-cytochrome c reductase iron-sulfur subunit [Gammaproteobacteria bacterium]